MTVQTAYTSSANLTDADDRRHRLAESALSRESLIFLLFIPAFTYLDNEAGCPSFLAINRLEQSGRVRGTLTVGDRVIPFDTTGHRDHSWGTRDWTAIHHYKWINIQGDGVAINFMHLLGLDQLWIFGCVDLDGVQSPIIAGRPTLERDSELYTFTSVHIDIDDALGRTTVVESGPRDVAVVWPAGGLLSHDAATYCTVNGRRALMHVEEGWTPGYVAHRAGGLWLRSTLDLSRFQAVVVPSG